MNKNNVLVIIDMQYAFETAHNNQTQGHIVKMIKLFRREHLPIINVVYKLHYRSMRMMSKIKRALTGYHFLYELTKRDDDGGVELYNLCEREGLKGYNFYFTGVNINCCVGHTACTLANHYPSSEVFVVHNCCNGTCREEDLPKYFLGGRFEIENDNLKLISLRLKDIAKKQTERQNVVVSPIRADAAFKA